MKPNCFLPVFVLPLVLAVLGTSTVSSCAALEAPKKKTLIASGAGTVNCLTPPLSRTGSFTGSAQALRAKNLIHPNRLFGREGRLEVEPVIEQMIPAPLMALVNQRL